MILPQQLIALAIIIFFVFKVKKQKDKNHISKNEFSFWLLFWSIASLAIIFIKQLDAILEKIGMTASGINFIFYLSVLILFYFVFRLRLNLAKLDNSLTELNKEMSIKRTKEEINEERN